MKTNFLKFSKHLRRGAKKGDPLVVWSPPRGHILKVDGHEINCVFEMTEHFDRGDKIEHSINLVDNDGDGYWEEGIDPKEVRQYNLYKKVV